MAEENSDLQNKSDAAPEQPGLDKAESKPSPEPDQSGQEVKDQAPSQDFTIPEKLKGKTAEEIAKQYIELESSLGKQGQELGELRKYSDERQMIAQVFQKNPELYQQVQKAVVDMSSNLENPAQAQQPDVKKEEEGKKPKTDPQMMQIRNREINRTIDEFKRNFSLDKLAGDKSKEMMDKISEQFADLADPSRSKSMRQILDDIDLSILPKMLENSYYLVNKDLLVDKGSLKPDMASVGSFAASSTNQSDQQGLTDAERQTAKKLGVSEDSYLKSKRGKK